MSWLKTMVGTIRSALMGLRTLNEIHDILLRDSVRHAARLSPNPLNRCGRKVFSQSDEDGIIFEMIKRIGIAEKPGTFAEFGVGDGLENNTLALAALGWRGFWVGGQDLAYEFPGNQRVAFYKDWITLDNIVQLTESGLGFLGENELDLISLDLDGNDIYLVEAILSRDIKPKIFVVEYNAKFPPPIEFQIDYDSGHVWRSDDYFGASLSSFAKLFERFGYRLVCCNSSTGANAFFVKNELMDKFVDVPTDINELYVAPFYHSYRKHGHRPSPRVVKTILK